MSAVTVKSLYVNLLHRRLGHLAIHTLKIVLNSRKTFVNINKIQELELCDACQFGKNHMLHFNYVQTTSTTLLQLLYADLCGPSHIVSSQGYTYYMSILDDFNRFTWIFPLSAKSDALPVFSSFKNFIGKHLQRSIKVVQTDWGGEFRSFSSILNNSRIHFRHPCPYIHHQNRRIERKHRHIVDVGLTLLAQAHLPLKF